MAETVILLPLTAEAQVRSRSTPFIFVVDTVVQGGGGFRRYFVLSLVSIIPPTLHIHLHLILLLPEGQTGES